MAAAFLKNNIVSVMQTVADFLVAPSTFTAANALLLNQDIEALRGSIQALPIKAVNKADLISRLDSIETLVAAFAAGTSTLSAVQVLNIVLSLLDLLNEKVKALHVPTPIGLLTVDFTKPFSTTCAICH